MEGAANDQPKQMVDETVIDRVARAISLIGFPEHNAGDGFAWWWHRLYDSPACTFEQENREEDRKKAMAAIAAISSLSVEGKIEAFQSKIDILTDELRKSNASGDALALENERLKELLKEEGHRVTDAEIEAVCLADLVCKLNARGDNSLLGMRVRKTSGHGFEGVVVGIVQKLDGQLRYVVEATHEAFAGTLFILAPSQIEEVADRGDGSADGR